MCPHASRVDWLPGSTWTSRSHPKELCAACGELAVRFWGGSSLCQREFATKQTPALSQEMQGVCLVWRPGLLRSGRGENGGGQAGRKPWAHGRENPRAWT